VKTASKLLSIAFAAAAVVTASLPAAQPAHAAGGFDLKPEIFTAYSYDGNRSLVVRVHNLGNVESARYTLMYYCDYLMDNGKVQRANAGTYPQLGTVSPGSFNGVTGGDCSKYQGRSAFRMGVYLAAPGDIDPSNNRAEKSFV
jgi:hypothetical protein